MIQSETLQKGNWVLVRARIVTHGQLHTAAYGEEQDPEYSYLPGKVAAIGEDTAIVNCVYNRVIDTGFNNLLPIRLTPELLTALGFTDSPDDNVLRPEANSVELKVPIPAGSGDIFNNDCKIKFMYKTGERFDRATGEYLVNKEDSSKQIHSLHELQNLYFALTGLKFAEFLFSK